MVFSDDGNGEAQEIQKNDYYSFGMAFESQQNAYGYTFGHKEEQNELGLEWLDFGARCLARDMGRWTSIDPLAGLYSGLSPYNYTLNNPVIYIDPDGMRVSLFDRLEEAGINFGADPPEVGEQTSKQGGWTSSVNENGIVTYTPSRGDNFETFRRRR